MDTADRNHAMLGAIQDMLDGLGGQIAAVQSAVAALAESVSTLSGDTAATAADIDGLTGKVDAANERIAGLDGKADAVGMGVAGLTGKVDGVNMHIDELAGKVDAANACAADLSAKADAIQSNFADLPARVDAVGSGASAIKAEVEGLKTSMAGHASANRLDPSCAERLDAIPDIRAALDALGERPDGTAALDAISDGITANSARIAALEDTINRIGTHIAGVAGKLDTVETAVERNVGPAPANLYKGEEKYTVTLGHFGDSARGKVQVGNTTTSKLAVTYTFSCKADAFVGRVSLVDRTIPWPNTAASSNSFGSVATVEGIRLWTGTLKPAAAPERRTPRPSTTST